MSIEIDGKLTKTEGTIGQNILDIGPIDLLIINLFPSFDDYKSKQIFKNDNFIILTEDREKKEIYELIINTNEKISYFVNNKLIFSFVDYLSKLLNDKERLTMSLILNITTCEEHNQYKVNNDIKNFIKFVIS